MEFKSAPDRLMVLIPDVLSSIINKGEVTWCYYNPGNLFKEVHLVLCNDDKPDFSKAQKMVGNAKLFIHNLPRPNFCKTIGWQLPLIQSWVKSGVTLVGDIKPNLIRVHNNFLEGYLASVIKKKFSVPYVISLHGVWDRDCLQTPLHWIRRQFLIKFERESLNNSNAVIAVYAPIIRYAKKYGAKRVELIYNIVAGDKIREKQSYTASNPFKIITINRQLSEKNPENIIKAIVNLNCEYWIIGDGEYHDRLQQLSRDLGIESKIHFQKAMPNDELCAFLATFDLMAAHCDYWGISKSTIEGAIAGLPLLLNKHPIEPIPELDGGWITLCENTPDDYRQAIEKFMDSELYRADCGQLALNHAQLNFQPEVMEKKTVTLYEELLAL